MNTCQTCKHWDKDDAKGHGMFPRLHPDAACRECVHPELVNVEFDGGYEMIPASGFGLDYPVCSLMTGPSFGCIKWEQRD